MKRGAPSDDDEASFNDLTHGQKVELKMAWAGMFPFRRYPSGKAISDEQGAAKFLKEYGPRMRRWNEKVNLWRWVESRCRNQKSTVIFVRSVDGSSVMKPLFP